MNVRIRPARAGDMAHVVAHLTRAGLPVEGVEDHFANYLVAEADAVVVGAIGMEVYGGEALLRSAVVAQDWRGRGVGTLLHDALLARAASLGITRLVLLTTSAEAYFSHRGFRAISVESVAGPLRASSEFRGACPSTAVCMERRL